MKYLFYLGIGVLILFEIANVYFIMPMPGSQRMRSIDVAYFLYTWRWVFRGVALLLIVVGLRSAYRAARWGVVGGVVAALAVAYAFNFRMAADVMFYQPHELSMLPASQSVVEPEKLVLGVAIDGQAKAYPIQYIGYHHQVVDSLAGKPIIVTYCTVCRTGRIFEPRVNGQPETFRLVGMDHFNAMFEDATTRSWWRQVNGEAIAGTLKGQQLPEVPSQQMTLRQWLALYPHSQVMQPDSAFGDIYKKMEPYETGGGSSALTKRDSTSWQEKSWVVGVQEGTLSKAYDWNELVEARSINDQLGSKAVAVVLAADNQSFFAFIRPDRTQPLSIQNDTLWYQNQPYSLLGAPLRGGAAPLQPLRAYQEFWHSWRTFHPTTEVYKN
ncbi:hypothetical protein GCM10027275_02090 [Rhabdobacter roseus]|uniref:DUF3179 domain-containing protein n=1 Tax=Rhabdobacter roseus TaxID=1655419 RepID=A0A840TDC4_9BACT|nr:DUF3179 domain-containing (seleno)protein [Rhabdobacter roseus]MBB5282096.1 hypothetical protein [Rhabdobacter roseus]